MTKAQLEAENQELARSLAWSRASRDKLLEVLADIVGEDEGRRELAFGRAMAMLNAIAPNT